MHEADFQTAQSALRGDTAAVSALAGRKGMLCRVLLSCGARSPSEADHLVADVLGDCFGARERARSTTTNRILEQYRGQCSLDSWLITVCRNRLRDLVSSAGESKVERGAHRDLPVRCESLVEPAIQRLISEALSDAMSQADPLALVFMRLVFLHGISQREVAAAWRCHESKVSRLLKDGFEAIQRETIVRLKRRDPLFCLEWNDLVRLCESTPQLLHGN